MVSSLWEDYSFVIRGKQRRKVIEAFDGPKIPTEIKQITHMNLTNVSRVLVSFEKKGLAKCLTPKLKVGRVYILTKIGEQVRKKIVRKTLREK